jgi:hypothetical protein
MVRHVTNSEIFGFIRSDVDAHTLGVSTVSNLLEECGYRVAIGDANLASAIANISESSSKHLILDWIKANNVSRLGFSYRLDPGNAQRNFRQIYGLLTNARMFAEQGGIIRQIYFSGLPEACIGIEKEYAGRVPAFIGDETQLETLQKLGVPGNRIPKKISEGSRYDDDRLAFAKTLINDAGHYSLKPQPRLEYEAYGTSRDTLVNRIRASRREGRPPLMRAHVGPFLPNYIEAKKLFNSWLKELGGTGFLDIVSIGTSQLSQSDFGKDWGNKPNGGGVPINSEKDLSEIWKAARPMLVRTYAGTQNIPKLAEVYESTIHAAWHALSFWWFNQIDGRGPHGVKENLEQHIETLRVIAKSGKPFEPNIPHHFSFRGGDDYTYVLSSYLAAKTAKGLGIKYLVLQTMLNTPKYTWGVQDLAKARALLALVRELEDDSFVVFLQPRAGLDYFSPDLNKAKVQLAAVSAMMDDIEPLNEASPDIIHVVSYCEGVKLATPKYINESIQITTHAINEYRKHKKAGDIDSMSNNNEVEERTRDIYHRVKSMVDLIEKNIKKPYSPSGLYEIFHLGVLTAPYLWEGRDEFRNAIRWKTRLVNGAVTVVDEKGIPIDPVNRVRDIFLDKTLGELRQGVI